MSHISSDPHKTRAHRALFFGLLLVILLFSLTACKANTHTKSGESEAQTQVQPPPEATPPADASYEDPLQDPTYEKTVMTSNPEFTKTELLKIMEDIIPITHSSMTEVLDYLSSKGGWERNRAYYILSKISVAEYILTEDDQTAAKERINQEYHQGMPTDKELKLVEKNRAAVHKGMGLKE